MEPKRKKLLLVAILLALLISWMISGISFFNNISLKNDLNQEKLNTESLLSEKLLLEKTLEKIKSEMNDLQGLNKRLDQKILQLDDELAKKESELKKQIASNAPLRSKVRELEAALSKAKEEFDILSKKYKEETEKLANEKMSLKNQLDKLIEESKKLEAANTILKAMSGNNHRVEAVRGKNDKITAFARRTQRVVFTFKIPKDVGNDLWFKLINPEGNIFESKDNKSATVKVTESSVNFYEESPELKSVGTKTIELIYKPESRLSKGIYMFKIYSGDQYIGSNSFRLR
ncbi:MAG: hypothetical protein KGZ97_00975 [Bacteroidetes bacterium]|nr:hypothetical protein [Bacteroidota bacterium]